MVSTQNVYPASLLTEVFKPCQTHLHLPEAGVDAIAYDTRTLIAGPRVVFFALKGHRDGHLFLKQAYQLGVRQFVVAQKEMVPSAWEDVNIWIVPDPLMALQQLAAYHRSQFQLPIIAITGSNGKTMVKEWLYQLLSPDYRIVRSPKSYNSQLGVALSLWGIHEGAQLAIIEAGISLPGEMEKLEALIRPTLGVLTNLGPAHEEGFLSLQQKADEKAQLLVHAKQLVLPQEFLEYWQPPQKALTLTWGNEGDLKVVDIQRKGPKETLLKANIGGIDRELIIPFGDAASIANALTCWAVMLQWGYEHQVIAERMRNLAPLSMRLELKEGIHETSIIDDSYSNDWASLHLALDFLNQQYQYPTRTLILSDIPSWKESSESQFQALAALLKQKNINALYTVGPQLKQYGDLFGGLLKGAFLDTQALLQALPSLPLQRQTILLKGARSYQFERISRQLTARSHETVLEINLNALQHNLQTFRVRVPKEVKWMAMVKAFSYGAGSFEIANVMQFNQVDYLTVAYMDEGIALRKAGILLPIMVMSPPVRYWEEMVKYRLEPEIIGLIQLKEWMIGLERNHIHDYPIHLKLDTGMHRLGMMEEDMPELLEALKGSNSIKVQSVFSHFVASGDPQHDAYTQHQIEVFKVRAAQIEKVLGYSVLKHLANTSGILRWPESHMDMVRLGIGLYGIGASEELPLHTVVQLKSTVSQVRRVPAGSSIGYQRRGVVHRDSLIATVNIGYADGYDRRFGNGVGTMQIGPHEVPTIGDICMDMCMLDVTGLEVQEGDEVLVYGDVARLAKRINTIPYELLTSVSQRVKRLYFYE
jgi:alanine racemase